MELKIEELMERVSPDTLVRIVSPYDDEIAVVLASDFAAGDPGVADILAPLRRRKVWSVRRGVSEDPLLPNNILPTVWAELEE